MTDRKTRFISSNKCVSCGKIMFPLEYVEEDVKKILWVCSCGRLRVTRNHFHWRKHIPVNFQFIGS